LTDYFSDLLESHSWSSVKLDLYGVQFHHVVDYISIKSMIDL
jgi:hypothetical protein